MPRYTVSARCLVLLAFLIARSDDQVLRDCMAACELLLARVGDDDRTLFPQET